MSDSQGASFMVLGVDVGALIAVVGTMEHFVPTILGILGGIWYCIEIYDCPRAVRFRERRAAKKANKNMIADATQTAALSVAKATADVTAQKITTAAEKTVAELTVPIGEANVIPSSDPLVPPADGPARSSQDQGGSPGSGVEQVRPV